MIPIVDVTVPADAFELGQLLHRLPGVRIELEQLVPLENSIIPLFWVSEGDPEKIEAILRESPLTEDVNFLADDGQRKLFRVHWNGEVNGLVQPLIKTNAKVLEAENVGEGWDFRLQFPSHGALSTFREHCESEGIPLMLRRLYNPKYPDEGKTLTTEQHDAILVAYERGYFNVPRETTVSELAAQFGISDNAFSQRLRRGLGTLIRETMVEP
jgi:predicted DNA binding protein